MSARSPARFAAAVPAVMASQAAACVAAVIEIAGMQSAISAAAKVIESSFFNAVSPAGFYFRALRHPASSASVQNHRSPRPLFMLTCA